MSYFFKNTKTNNKNPYASFKIDSLLDDLLYSHSLNEYPVQSNILSKENEILIQLQVPGIPKEEININYKNNQLSVSYDAPKEDYIEGEYIQQQIFLDGFKNTFKLSDDLDTKNISANSDNGILNITIPRKKNKNSTRIKIT